jgi:uncharacterized protein (DUF1697 family)
LPKYAALLRGINVGRNKRVAMEDLRKILGSLGHVDVKTYLNSGNVGDEAQCLDAEGLTPQTGCATGPRTGQPLGSSMTSSS